MNQPIQQIETDEKGVIRFKSNAIVQHLLDQSPLNLHDLASLDFPQADREQFAQLIGYSLSGYSELPYVSTETYETAERMQAQGITAEQARIQYLEETLKALNVKDTGPFGIYYR